MADGPFKTKKHQRFVCWSKQIRLLSTEDTKDGNMLRKMQGLVKRTSPPGPVREVLAEVWSKWFFWEGHRATQKMSATKTRRTH